MVQIMVVLTLQIIKKSWCYSSNGHKPFFKTLVTLYICILIWVPKHRHEIAGEVTEVGSKVRNFKVGDKVGVGCMVISCRSCQSCEDNLENYCPKMIDIFRQVCWWHHHIWRLTLDAAAPLLCAGITVYSPLRYYGLDKPGLNLGVVGLGGLGHMAVKFAKALGANVTVISTSPNKKKEAIENIGADSFVVSREQDQMQVRQYKKLWGKYFFNICIFSETCF